MPLQVVQAKATMPKPSCSNSPSRFASSRYSCTALEPGAKEDLTQGLRVRPRALALRASSARDNVAWIAGICATGDCCNDYRAIGHFALIGIYGATDTPELIGRWLPLGGEDSRVPRCCDRLLKDQTATLVRNLLRP